MLNEEKWQQLVLAPYPGTPPPYSLGSKPTRSPALSALCPRPYLSRRREGFPECMGGYSFQSFNQQDQSGRSHRSILSPCLTPSCTLFLLPFLPFWTLESTNLSVNHRLRFPKIWKCLSLPEAGRVCGRQRNPKSLAIWSPR